MRVVVLAGGRSSEHDVSLDSAATVTEALRAGGHEVETVRLERDGALDGPGRQPLALAPGGGLLGADVVFPVLHGPFGEDGTIQGLLELLDVAYVGAGRARLVAVHGQDRLQGGAGRRRGAAGRPTPPCCETEWRADAGAVRARLAALGLPVFVKPARLGSSVGISKVSAEDELDAALETAFGHDGLVIVEAFSPGIEVECSVTGLGDPEVSLPAEVVLQGADWYDYEAKYSPGGVELAIPARVGDEVIEEVRRLARETFLRAGCAGLARVDFFVEDDRVLVNELNTLPGHDRHQRLPEDVGGDGRAVPARSATGCWATGSSATAPSAATPSRS